MNTLKLASLLDELLAIDQVRDDSLNGLQVANRGEVRKVAFAVDASLRAFTMAQEEQATMVFVHHGLFWGHEMSITGGHYQRIQKLIQADMALYAVHLPLDRHAEFGNSSVAASLLEWPDHEEFGIYHDVPIGRKVRFKSGKSVEAIKSQVEETLSCQAILWPFGPESVEHAAFVSGGGISLMEQAIEAGIDLFITGEPKHSYYWTAKEAGINVMFAGHYATEILGVSAVAHYLRETTGLETVILDLPTGH